MDHIEGISGLAITDLSDEKEAGARNHDFDANGNRTTDGAGTTAAYAPASDRIQTVNGAGVALDASGNLIGDGSYKYAWNALGQLAEIRLADDTLIASYHYDHRNLRTRKVTTAAAPQGISKTFYHYDEADRLIAETAPGNVPLMTYVWNGDRLTGLIVHQPARTVYAVQTDHLGSPFQVRTLTGTVVWRWEPEAFGKTQPNEDPDGDGSRLTLNLRFPGQYFDAESGLHYNWNRYYSPRLARYISSDPIGIVGGINTYTYVENNPIGNVDPSGLLLTVIHAMRRGMSPQQAMQASQVGNAGAAVLLGVAGAAASATAISRLPSAARSAAQSCQQLRDPCRYAVLSAVLGAGICKGDPADDFLNDMKNREEIRRGSEMAGQKKIGNQKQNP